MSRNLKDPTTFKQQVGLLQSKDINIPDPAECEAYLSRVNYYRLSGYVYPFLDHANGVCSPPLEFSRLANIYAFDASLRALIASAIEVIEIYARTRIAYDHAHNYGADGYMYAHSFNHRHDHPRFQSLVSSCIYENRRSPVVIHHMNIYGGRFPLWVIVDYFSLGMLSHFFADLLNRDKGRIAISMYSVNYQTMTSWLRCLTDLRNRCAHYSRLYNWNFPAVPAMPRSVDFIADHSLFSQLYMLKLMYPLPDRWDEDFVNPLSALMEKYGDDINLVHIGFPERWRSMLLA